MRHLLLAPLLRWLGRLSYPRLFVVTATLFLLSVLIPDPIPLIDELLLGLGTLLLANWKRRTDPQSRDGLRRPIEGQAKRER